MIDEILIKIDMMFWEKYVGIMHEKKISFYKSQFNTFWWLSQFSLRCWKKFSNKRLFFLS